MPYYIACLKESLRLNPPIPNLLPRFTPEDGVTIEGMFIPPGTEVTTRTWVAGRDEALYGEDVKEFKPERWLQSAEQSPLCEKYSLVWGMGRGRVWEGRLRLWSYIRRLCR